MIVLITETAYESLQGVIDDVNRTYVVSYDYAETTVNVYVNGRLKVASLDDGFDLVPPRTVVMKEALLVGDTLEIEYQTSAAGVTGGGAQGGVPGPMRIVQLDPDVITHGERVPDVSAETLQPRTFSRHDGPQLTAEDLRPVLSGRE
jgi:hypothetical protein